MLKKCFVVGTLVFALDSAFCSSTATAANSSIVPSSQQGVHQWAVGGGRLFLVNGTYQDTTTYKRSMTFYFQEKERNDWEHVPIIESETDHSLTWFSISRVDETVADAIVRSERDGIYFITVFAEKTNGYVVITYKFVESGDDFPDGPGHVFKPIGKKSCAPQRCTSVEDALKKLSM